MCTHRGFGALHQTRRAEAQAPGAHVASQARLEANRSRGGGSCRAQASGFSCGGPCPVHMQHPFPILPQDLLPGCGSPRGGSHADMLGTTPSVGALAGGRWGLSFRGELTYWAALHGATHLYSGTHCSPSGSPHATAASLAHLPQISPAPLGEPHAEHTESESGNVISGSCTYAHSWVVFKHSLTWKPLPAVEFPRREDQGPIASKSC